LPRGGASAHDAPMPTGIAVLALVLTMPTDTLAQEHEILSRLNADYIDSVQTSNVARFREILADDFLASMPDGTILTRAQFLESSAKPVTITRLAAHDVNIRLMGDFAIIHARTTYTLADGKQASGRYTDVWAKRNGRWVAVAAHVTRN
jgi:ketosteroid isomerase-like protein